MRYVSILVMVVAMHMATACTMASPIYFSMEFPGGFDVSINGGPLTPSGPILITGTVDDTAPDLYDEPLYGHLYGEFETSEVRFTGGGFVNELVASPIGFISFAFTLGMNDYFALELLGQFNTGVIGWHGESSSGSYIADVNDLSTVFTLPYTTIGTSTFWGGDGGLSGNAWTLAGGDTITADTGSGGPDGVFSLSREPISAVPEPTSLALLLGLTGATLLYRRTQRIRDRIRESAQNGRATCGSRLKWE